MISVEEVLLVMIENRLDEIGFVPPLLPPEAEKDFDSAAEALLLDLAARLDDGGGILPTESGGGMVNHDVVRRLAASWGPWPTAMHLATRWAISAGTRDSTQTDAVITHVSHDDQGNLIVPSDALSLTRGMLVCGAEHAKHQKAGTLDDDTAKSIWSIVVIMAHSLVAEEEDIHRAEGAVWWWLEMLLFAALGSL